MIINILNYFLTVALLLNFSYRRVLGGNNIINLNNNSNPSNLRHEHLCINGQVLDWCIPLDYNDRNEPWRYKEIIQATFPWTYEFKFFIFDIQEVDDEKQTVSLSMYFTIAWLEPRIEINETAAAWDDTTYGLPDTIDIAPEVMKYFWNPDLEIYGMEHFASKSILKEMSSLKIRKDRRIEYMARVDIKISCQMKFDQYPLDKQQCPFRIGSYYSSDDTVNCTETYHFDQERQRSLQYSIEIDSLPEKYRSFTYDSKRFAICGVNILLMRTRKQTFYQVYLISILFVIVSWISFIIKPKVVAGRMALLITIFLILINTFNSVKNEAPTSKTLNSVDLYLLICIGIVFLALIEYAIVLFKDRYKGSIMPSLKPMLSMKTSTSVNDQKNKSLKAWEEDNLSEMNKLDNFSLILFPISFLAFNVFYCINHI